MRFSIVLNCDCFMITLMDDVRFIIYDYDDGDDNSNDGVINYDSNNITDEDCGNYDITDDDHGNSDIYI